MLKKYLQLMCGVTRMCKDQNMQNAGQIILDYTRKAYLISRPYENYVIYTRSYVFVLKEWEINSGGIDIERELGQEMEKLVLGG